MTKIYTLVLFLFSSVLLGQSIDLQFVDSDSTDCAMGSFCVDLQIQGNNGADYLGTSSIFFTYNSAAIILDGNQDGLTQGAYYPINFDITTTNTECTNGSPYSEHFYDGNTPGSFLMTLILSSPTFGSNVFACPNISNDWITISTICFDIVDSNGNPNIVVQGQQNGPPMEVSESNFNSDTNNPNDKYDNGTFTPYNTPLLPVCSGCTDNTACNYDPTASIDDGSCNLPDCLGNCNGDNTGPSISGTTCNDGDDCTINDVFTTNCNCAGTFQDSDSDSVCDADDVCPNFDDGLIGTTCNDGDDCTINDVFTVNCNCAGTFQDSDSDSVCDADDVCIGPDPGQVCDDGNAATVGDVIDNNCNCAGILPSCLEEIVLSPGWNLVSSNCVPANLDMTAVFSAISGNVVEVKDLTHSYAPSLNSNSIGDWDITSSYKVKVLVQDTLYISGTVVDPLATPINLNVGWNNIAYLLDENGDPATLFAPIVGSILEVQDLNGIYNPNTGTNTLIPMMPTEGFYIKMSAPAAFIMDPANAGNP